MSMDSQTNREATTYTMLHQVVANQCALHGMSPASVVVGSCGLIAGIVADYISCGADEQTMLSALRTALHQSMATEQTAPPEPWDSAESDEENPHTIELAHAALLAEILNTLVRDANSAGLMLDGAWRIGVRLLCDAVMMLGYQYEWTPEEYVGFVDDGLMHALEDTLKARASWHLPSPDSA